jgi:hypothetical protein
MRFQMLLVSRFAACDARCCLYVPCRDLMDSFKADAFLHNLFVVCSRAGKLHLQVNLDARQVVVAREVRALSQLAGFKAIPSIASYADQLTRVYPYATCLSEAIRTYFAASRRVSPSTTVLLAGPRKRMHRLMQLGVDARVVAASKELQRDLSKDLARAGNAGTFVEDFMRRREFAHLDIYARKLHECALSFEAQVDEALTKSSAVDAALNHVATCALEQETLTAALGMLQNLVTELELTSFSNLGAWVRALDAKVEGILLARLQQLLDMWLRCFPSSSSLPSDHGVTASGSQRHESDVDEAKAPGAQVTSYVQELARNAYTRHEIKIKNGALLVDPPLGMTSFMALMARKSCTFRTISHAYRGSVCMKLPL